jgi:hypothetical protein
MSQSQPWFKNHWRRILVDMHIPDWDERFLSQVDPEKYTDRMVQGGATSAMVYTNSHVGLCLYPTKTGKMHAGLRGRDFFGETLNLCHKRGLTVTAYHSLIFNNWAHINYPDWRISSTKSDLLSTDRYGTCCPNSPYRQFTLDQTAEVCRYDCDSIFFDMTFWPKGVCTCPHCTARYRKETGKEIPQIVDWQNPEWTRFQRRREQWMDEYARVMTEQVRNVNPKMTVTHQFSTVLHGWAFGVPFSFADRCDYLSGDFYGETIQQSIVCKAFFSLALQRPFEFHTSRCLDLHDHVTTKSQERLETQAFLAPAHSSAFMFIDAIDPVGTLNSGTYSRIRCVFDKLATYEPELGGDLCADVAVYFSQESKFNPIDNGKKITEVSDVTPMPHWEAILGACRSLQTGHIPFTVVTKRNLADLAKFKVLVLPDVLIMDAAEIEAVRTFVKNGGGLYASARTSIQQADGTPAENFMLADVFGVTLQKDRFPGLTFFTPAADQTRQWIWPQDHMIHFEGQLSIQTAAQVLMTRTLPYTDPLKGEVFGHTFSSIHSNPPGPAGNEPALVVNQYGKGKVVYCAGAMEAVNHDVNRKVFQNLIRMLSNEPELIRLTAHEGFEVTVFNQPDRKRLRVSFLNSLPELAQVPSNVKMELRIPPGVKEKTLRLVRLPDRQVIPHTVKDGYVHAVIPDVSIFAMVALEFE